MHLAAVLPEQHVGGLQVAVDNAVGVADGERVGDLGGEQGRPDGCERTVLPEVPVQVGALDQVHDERQQIALDDEVPHPHDVGVGEPEQHGALPQEPHHDVRVARELLLEDLDRDGLAGVSGHGRLGPRGLPLAGAPDSACGAASNGLLKEVLAPYRPHVMRSLLLACLVTPWSPADVPNHCSAAVRGTGLSSS